ncbi:autotransporter assembly complex protein TamA [Endozoicomonas arenosclerae]|uniref:autotransporter assembly complex protein TamA n=1 Tax=Endozoicomonas arenosclerae TaxID=1633495 RepID=UPI000AED08E1|nr:autotransporter assembly complex family protein [Endozoicomonas arenosclerae]
MGNLNTFLKVVALLLSMLIIESKALSSLTYDVKGLKDGQKRNAELFLQTLPAIEPDQLPRYQPSILEAVQNALKALGYYHPTISMALDAKDHNQLNIQVDPGQPILIRNIKVELKGEARKNRTFKKIVKRSPLKKGAVFNSGEYEDLKSSLSTQGQSLGFFDAQMQTHTVKIYPGDYAADVELVFDSGKRYRFGEIVYGEIPENTKALIEEMLTFKPGSKYRSVRLGNLNKDLASTGYFQQIDIRPMRNRTENYHVPIFINVSPNKNYEIETGAGYSTDEGPRLSLTWDIPLINDRGHSLTNEALISAPRTELTSSYKIPYGNPLTEFYDLQAGYQYKKQEDTKSNLASTAIHKWNKNPQGWDRDLFFRIQYESYEQGLQDGESFLMIPGISMTQRRAKGGKLDPRSGYLIMSKAEFSEKLWGSDQNFVKLWGRTKGLTTLAEKHRFIGRVEQGAIWINDVNKIPPSIRFFTGGDQTVRGYNYESIAPKDANGKLIGAQYMTALSVEYNYQFLEHWRAAVFVDSGTATNDYKDDWKTGAGFGIRWVTPLGALRVDLAFAVSEPGTPYKLHFSMGPEI